MRTPLEADDLELFRCPFLRNFDNHSRLTILVLLPSYNYLLTLRLLRLFSSMCHEYLQDFAISDSTAETLDCY
jgi:hypothetical protein